MSEEPAPAPESAAEDVPAAESGTTAAAAAPLTEPAAEEAAQAPRPRQPRNDFSWAGMIIGIVAFVLNVAADVGYGPGLAGVLFSGIGVWVATRHDIGMARSLSGLLLSLFALAVAVYTAGITSYQ